MTPSTTFLALQHISCEPPALYEDVLRARGADLVQVEVDEGERIPDPRQFTGVLVMGGPMGAYEDADHPWLVQEKRALRQAVDADVPCWGVCLGAQLLAAALDARVYPGPTPEVGIGEVFLTGAATGDPVFADAPATFRALQWHGDTFDLPADAALLAGSNAYQNQAFAYGRSYGLQFHLEVPLELAKEWAEVPAYARSLEDVHGPGAMPRLVDDIAANVEHTAAVATTLFTNWLDRVVRLDQEAVRS